MSKLQVYTIKDVDNKPWDHPNGSKWYSVALEELSEPVKYIVDGKKISETPEKGMKLNGWINQPEGKKYQIFNPSDEPAEKAEAKTSSSYQDGMKWGNSLNNATQLVVNYGGEMPLDEAVSRVLDIAELLYKNERPPIHEEIEV